MHTTTRLPFVFPFVAAGALAVVTGCTSSTNSNMGRTVHTSNLDDCNQVRLLHRCTKSREGLGATQRCEQMVVVVEPRQTQSAEYVLKRTDVDEWPSWSSFEFGSIEARSDATRQRIWFVDTQTGKIAGSIDRETGQTTGPDDTTPAWATSTNGERLELVGK